MSSCRATNAKARLNAATPGPLLSSNGYPRMDGYGCCNVCDAWIPRDHPEAHDHQDGCVAEDQYIQYRSAFRELTTHAPTDIAALIAEVEALRSEALTMRQWAEEAAAAENANARELREARAEVARLRALLGLE